LDFNVRVGINTGPVVVGEIGSDLALEYTAMGDAINLAARMESTALPGTVQITDHTYKLVAPLFDVWDAGPIQVKGKAEPVQAYRVLGWRASGWPGHVRGVEGLDAPLIGRDKELDLLRQVMADLHQGRGGIVCLIGEAGLGKTRLIEELSGEWPASGPGEDGALLWLESRGVSYDAAQPYGLFLTFIRQNMGIRDHDALDVVRAKITRSMANLPAQQRALMSQVIETVLGVNAGADPPPLEGEDLKRELFATLLGTARAVASSRPTVMLCEDLHWADPASIDLLLHLFQLVEQVPLLFLCTYRPDRQSPVFAFKAPLSDLYGQQYTEIRLQPLTEQESDRLVSSLLSIDDLPADLRRSIFRKAEGNPFFVQEVVRSLIDSGAVIQDEQGVRWNRETRLQDITIPDNVQSLIIARFDRLDTETRRTLQIAAVIGQTFDHRVLKELVGATVALDKQLDTLQRAGLIREVARGLEPAYTFHHALTRDAAYASILHRRRRLLHRQVGQALESLFPERLSEEAHLLAEHFDAARDDERALRYYTLAGDHAARIYANTAAVGHYARAIEIARQGAGADAGAREGDGGPLIYLYTRRGRAFEINGRYDDALLNYQELEALARERDDRALELSALIPQATLRSTFTAKFNPGLGRALAERALALAQALQDHHAEAKALWNLMLIAHFGDDDQGQAVAFGERSLALARAHDLKEQLAYTLHDIANAYLDLGRRDQAWRAYEEVDGLWQELGNLPMRVDNLANSAWHHYQAGRLEQALARVDEGLRMSRSIGSLWGQAYSLMTLGPFYLAGGAYAQAIAALEEAIPLAERANFDVHNELRVALGGIYGFLGDLERAVDLIQGVHATSKRREDRLLALMMLAQVYLHHGQPAHAAAAYQAAQAQFAAGSSNPTLSMYRMVAPVIEAELALGERAYERVLTLANDAMRQTRRLTALAALMRIKSQALLALGQVEEATETLSQARVATVTPDANRMNWLILYMLWSRRTLWQVLLTLGRLEARRGGQAEAQALVGEARALVRAIAGNAGTPELGAKFLSLPDARAVLDPPFLRAG
jgi:tetratricopeptide (TPR) repeat protein